jgi:hypothetical protein
VLRMRRGQNGSAMFRRIVPHLLIRPAQDTIANDVVDVGGAERWVAARAVAAAVNAFGEPVDGVASRCGVHWIVNQVRPLRGSLWRTVLIEHVCQLAQCDFCVGLIVADPPISER